LRADGSVWVWGDNPYGQLGVGHYEDLHVPTRLEPVPKAKKVACGSWHTMMIDINDEVWCWGRNENGMLGNNSTVNSTVPVKLELKGIKDIGAGCFQSIAIDHNENIWVWGENWNGQLGIANYKRMLTPTKALINFENQIEITAQHQAEMHQEAKAALGLPLGIDNNSGPGQGEGRQTVSKGQNIRAFIKYNKKFLLSFALNIVLLYLLFRSGKKG